MGREIKFRGKAIMSIEELDELGAEHVNGWVYGNLITNGNQPWIVGDIADVDSEYIALEGWIKVVPETVGQLLVIYRDLKTIEIYEGAIIEFEDVGEEGYEYKEGIDLTNRAVVAFENGQFTLDKFAYDDTAVCGELLDQEAVLITIAEAKVIGNFYEHPHLLEVPHEQS